MSGSKISGTDTQLFYSLIIKQLREDGYGEAANSVALLTKIRINKIIFKFIFILEEIKNIGLPSLAQIIRQHISIFLFAAILYIIVTASDVPQETGEEAPISIHHLNLSIYYSFAGTIQSRIYHQT